MPGGHCDDAMRMGDAVADATELVRTTFPTARWAALGGGGKRIVRELRDLDPALAQRWEAAATDREAVVALAQEMLDRAGGLLFDGYLRPDLRRPR